MGTNYHHLHKNGDVHHQVSACVCLLLSQGQIYLSFLLSISSIRKKIVFTLLGEWKCKEEEAAWKH